MAKKIIGPSAEKIERDFKKKREKEGELVVRDFSYPPETAKKLKKTLRVRGIWP